MNLTKLQFIEILIISPIIAKENNAKRFNFPR
jgi:hypothetical protein